MSSKFSIQFELNHAHLKRADLIYNDSITSDSTNIKTKNKYDLADYNLLNKMMLRGSHDPQASKISATSQAGTFSTKIPLTHNNVSLVHTHYLVPVPC